MIFLQPFTLIELKFEEMDRIMGSTNAMTATSSMEMDEIKIERLNSAISDCWVLPLIVMYEKKFVVTLLTSIDLTEMMEIELMGMDEIKTVGMRNDMNAREGRSHHLILVNS